MMTRKHFKAIAGAIADTYAATNDGMGKAALVMAAQRIADRLGENNPNFNRTVFMQAALPPAKVQKPMNVRVV